jgi:hypothetical protein
MSKGILVSHDIKKGSKTKITSHSKREVIVKTEREKGTRVAIRGTEAEVDLVTARKRSTIPQHNLLAAPDIILQEKTGQVRREKSKKSRKEADTGRRGSPTRG